MKNYYHTSPTFELLGEVKNHDFNIKDEKGRAVGLNTAVFKASGESFDTLEELKEHLGNPSHFGFRELPFKENKYWEVRSHATRDGEIYGALTKDFSTAKLEEASKEEARRIYAAIKRYVKKYGVQKAAA